MPKVECSVQVRGEGPKHAKIMIIGEAPGKDEILQKRPFVGRAGRFLDEVLAEVGLERSQCYITNVVKFRPTRVLHGKIKNRAPTSDEISACLPLLKREIARARPHLIVLLGSTPTRALTGEKFSKMRGKAVRMLTAVSPVHQSIVLATYHPAAAMRNRKLRKVFVSDLKSAAKLAKSKIADVEFFQPPRTDWHVHTSCSD